LLKYLVGPSKQEFLHYATCFLDDIKTIALANGKKGDMALVFSSSFAFSFVLAEGSKAKLVSELLPRWPAGGRGVRVGVFKANQGRDGGKAS